MDYAMYLPTDGLMFALVVLLFFASTTRPSPETGEKYERGNR